MNKCKLIFFSLREILSNFSEKRKFTWNQLLSLLILTYEWRQNQYLMNVKSFPRLHAHIRTRTHARTQTDRHTYKCRNTYIYECQFVCVCVWVQTPLYTFLSLHRLLGRTSVYTHIRTQTTNHTHTHTHTHIYIYIYIYRYYSVQLNQSWE